MDSFERKTLVGTVIFLAASQGSKSEGSYPFLYLGRGAKPVRLALKGDNPFENRGLSEYDGKAVEVSGRPADGGTLVVDEIKVVSTQGEQQQ